MLGGQTLLQKVWLSGGVGRSEPEHGIGKGIQWGLAGWTTALEGHPLPGGEAKESPCE